MINYRGKDEKVLVRFTKAVLPTGREIAVKAQGMIKGDYHEGRPGFQAAATLGPFDGGRGLARF